MLLPLDVVNIEALRKAAAIFRNIYIILERRRRRRIKKEARKLFVCDFSSFDSRIRAGLRRKSL